MDKDKIFIIKHNELSKRLDPFYYKSIFLSIVKKLHSINSISLKSLKVNIRKGIFDLSPNNYQKNGIPFLRVSDIKEGTINFDHTVFISNEKHQEESYTKYFPRDLVISKVGTIGEIAILPDVYPEYNISQNLVGLRLNNDIKTIIQSEFLQICLRSKFGILQFNRQFTTGVQPKITLDAIREILIPIPCIETQENIIAKIDDAYAAKKQKELEAQRLLESIDDYLLGELGIELPEPEENTIKNRVFIRNLSEVSGDRFDPYFYMITFKRIEDVINQLSFPSIRLGDIFEINRGGSPRPINKYYTDSDDGVNWIKIGDTKHDDKYIYFTQQKIKPEGCRYSRAVFDGDFLLSNSMSFGKPYIMKTSGFIHDGWLLLRPKMSDVNNDYLHAIIGSKLIYSLFKRSTICGVVYNLNIDLVKKIKIPLPPLEKQIEISEHITAIRNQAKQLQQQAKDDLEKAKQEVEAMILGDD